jgi:hypothetical protein
MGHFAGAVETETEGARGHFAMRGSGTWFRSKEQRLELEREREGWVGGDEL